MKHSKPYIILCAILTLLFTGCATLQTPAGKAVFNIALRSIAYEVGQKNPDSVGKMVEFASFLSGLESYLSPQAFSLVVDERIDESSMDEFQKGNVRELGTLVKEYYNQLHEQHGDKLTKSQALEVVQSIGSALNFGLVPSTDGPTEFVLKSDSLIVVVD